MNKWYKFTKEEFPEQYERMQKYGRRSVSFSTIAPTGSVSILTQTTSGCEPIFQPFYMRRKKINPNDEGSRVDFVDESGDSWQEFPVIHEKFKDWIKIQNSNRLHTLLLTEGRDVEELTKEELQEWFKKSPWYGSTANDIDWQKRNEMQAVLQKYTTNAISSTINLPSTVTEKEVSDIYMNGWKLGLKGQTVYVDGSRSGVLVSNDDKSRNQDLFEYTSATKRPKELVGYAHKSTSKGVEYTVVVGTQDDKPYEIFITENSFEGRGKVDKYKKGDYKFVSDSGKVYDITTTMNEEQVAITRMTSTSLRHGGDIKFIVEQLRKSSSSMFGFTGSLSRVLAKFIPDGSASTVTCEDCGSDEVIFEEGCFSCKSCGGGACS